jgi:hypothetical protein
MNNFLAIMAFKLKFVLVWHAGILAARSAHSLTKGNLRVIFSELRWPHATPDTLRSMKCNASFSLIVPSRAIASIYSGASPARHQGVGLSATPV